MITVSDQDLVLAYKCNEVIDFSLSRGESIADIDTDHTVHVICTEYTSEPFKEIMADLIRFMNDYPINKAKSVSISDDDLRLAYLVDDRINHVNTLRSSGYISKNVSLDVMSCHISDFLVKVSAEGL